MNNSNDVLEIDLLQILEVVKKNILIFIAICILTCTAGFAYGKFYLSETYSATAKIIIVKDETNMNSSNVTSADISLSQKLAATYKQILMSEAISDEVIDNLGLNISTGTYNSMVSVNAADNTEIMNINVTSSSPELCAKMANEIVDVFMSKIYDIMNIQNVSILNRAKVPTAKSGPNISKYVTIGLVIGLAICALIAVIKTLTDTKIKTEDDLKKIVDYPIIGLIPNFLEKEVDYDD